MDAQLPGPHPLNTHALLASVEAQNESGALDTGHACLSSGDCGGHEVCTTSGGPCLGPREF